MRYFVEEQASYHIAPAGGGEFMLHTNRGSRYLKRAAVIIKGLLGLLLDLKTSHSTPVGSGNRKENGVNNE